MSVCAEVIPPVTRRPARTIQATSRISSIPEF
jgi:hypothetical protein